MLLVTYLTLLLTILSPTLNHAEEQQKEEPPKKVEEEDNFDYNNQDWGTFYDPKGIFCGDYDCYKILGLDYNELLNTKITDDLLKRVTKRYRKLSRKWHPDKNKSSDAKDRFVVSSIVLLLLLEYVRYNLLICIIENQSGI